MPELDDTLAKCLSAADDKTIPHRILVFFGEVEDHRFDRFGRLLFDWFRCPVLDVTVENGGRPQIKRLAAVPVTKLSPAELQLFHSALHEHTRREWRSKKDRAAPRYSFAVLFDPNEKLPPTSAEQLQQLWRQMRASVIGSAAGARLAVRNGDRILLKRASSSARSFSGSAEAARSRL